ncbi:3-oxoacyl-ACP synthase [Bacillus anthracis]|nr:3-oxoacyl-ACP synthase [Bacillus anthracis]
MCTTIGTFIFLENLKKYLDKMVKWQPFASMPEQFVCIKDMIQEQTKIPRPILTQDAKGRIENKLLISYLGEEEILLTYYKNGYLYKNYITVADINPLNRTITCSPPMLLIIKECLSLVM